MVFPYWLLYNHVLMAIMADFVCVIDGKGLRGKVTLTALRSFRKMQLVHLVACNVWKLNVCEGSCFFRSQFAIQQGAFAIRIVTGRFGVLAACRACEQRDKQQQPLS